MIDSKVTNHFLQSLKSTHKLYVWKFSAGSLITAEIQFVKLDRFSIYAKIEQASLYSMSRILGGIGKIQLYDEINGYLALCDVRSFDNENELVLSHPEVIEKLDRREHSRYFFKNLFQLKIKLEELEPQFFHCADIGPGGFSVLVTNRNEKSRFAIGSSGEVYLGDSGEALSVELVREQKLKPYAFEKIPYAKKKLSFKFRNIPANWAESISQFIDKKQQERG
jgi:hypothetical protein